MYSVKTWIIPKEEIIVADRLDAKYFSPEFRNTIKTLKNSFKTTKLADLCIDNTPKRGTAPYRPEYVEFGIPVIRTDDLSNKGIKWNNVAYIPYSLYEMKYKGQELRVSDILLSSTGVSTGKVDIVGFIPKQFENRALITPKITLIRIQQEDINPYFLTAYLRTYYAQIQIKSMIRGTGEPELYPEDIKKIIVPILSEDIQKEIGDKIREAERLREEVLEIQLELKQLENEIFGMELEKKSIWIIPAEELSQRLDAKFYNPNKLKVLKILKENFEEIVKIGEICENGFPKRGNAPHKPQYVNFGVPVIITKCLTNFGIDWDNVEYIREEDFEKRERRCLRKDDIIIASTGLGSIGKVDVLSKIPDEFNQRCLATPELTIIRLKKDYSIDPYYICFYLRSPYGQIQIHSSTRGESGQLHLYPEDIKEIIVPILDKKTQNKISSKLKKFEELRMKAIELMKSATKELEDIIIKLLNQ